MDGIGWLSCKNSATHFHRHFFELVRFDFILDESLKVWLMEVS